MGTGVVNLKIGHFELELPFSDLRRLSSAIAPYEVYAIQGVKGSFRLSSPQVGIALNGYKQMGLNALRYEAALVNGTNGAFDNNVEKDFYGRLAFSRLFDGFLKSVRLGGLYYKGMQNLRDLAGNPYPTAAMRDYWGDEFSINVHANPENASFYRWGIDASIDLKIPDFSLGPLPLGWSINLYGQYLVGHDDDIDMTNMNMPYFGSSGDAGGGDIHKSLASHDPDWLTRPFDYSGGFVGADIIVLPAKFYLIGRYDWLTASNQWADPVDGVDGAYVRPAGSASWLDGEIRRYNGDPMPRGMTSNLQANPDDAINSLSRISIGFRFHFIQPVTLIYEYSSQQNLWGFPEPPPLMYNPDWVAGMGRIVNVDSNWHMIMFMFAF